MTLVGAAGIITSTFIDIGAGPVVVLQGKTGRTSTVETPHLVDTEVRTTSVFIVALVNVPTPPIVPQREAVGAGAHEGAIGVGTLVGTATLIDVTLIDVPAGLVVPPQPVAGVARASEASVVVVTYLTAAAPVLATLIHVDALPRDDFVEHFEFRYVLRVISVKLGVEPPAFRASTFVSPRLVGAQVAASTVVLEAFVYVLAFQCLAFRQRHPSRTLALHPAFSVDAEVTTAAIVIPTLVHINTLIAAQRSVLLHFEGVAAGTATLMSTLQVVAYMATITIVLETLIYVNTYVKLFIGASFLQQLQAIWTDTLIAAVEVGTDVCTAAVLLLTLIHVNTLMLVGTEREARRTMARVGTVEIRAEVRAAVVSPTLVYIDTGVVV